MATLVTATATATATVSAPATTVAAETTPVAMGRVRGRVGAVATELRPRTQHRPRFSAQRQAAAVAAAAVTVVAIATAVVVAPAAVAVAAPTAGSLGNLALLRTGPTPLAHHPLRRNGTTTTAEVTSIRWSRRRASLRTRWMRRRLHLCLLSLLPLCSESHVLRQQQHQRQHLPCRPAHQTRPCLQAPHPLLEGRRGLAGTTR
mmetsp:Transcript_16698/g.53315  ORF Transcript_16698/g.53315 Transcript_16698/m.53315 type:complete len:203 (-) Transcript_16698:1459-2067(-)